MTEIVYSASCRGASGSPAYHTDRECPHLGQVGEVFEYRRDAISDRRELCSWCDGERPPAPDDESWSAYRALRDANPEVEG